MKPDINDERGGIIMTKYQTEEGPILSDRGRLNRAYDESHPGTNRDEAFDRFESRMSRSKFEKDEPCGLSGPPFPGQGGGFRAKQSEKPINRVEVLRKALRRVLGSRIQTIGRVFRG